jgi:glycine dehydrogenase subunit 1
VVVQQPDFFGTIRDLSAVAARCREVGALLVYAVGDPVSLGLLKTPGAWGADIAVGEGQGLGLPLQFGGPGVGLMACKQQHLRQLPGRIVGQTTDHDGRRGFVLTLQAREQHIRREKATSNICTSQTLLALGATIYLASLGPVGLKQAAGLSHKQTRKLAERIKGVSGYRVVNDGPFFNEITVVCPEDADNVRHQLAKHGIIGGYALGREYPEIARGLVLCATERTTDAELDRLVAALGEIGGGR